MCGLVGIAGPINKIDKDAFKHLLYIDATRGMDSTGLLMVEAGTKKNSKIIKDAYDASYFLYANYDKVDKTTNLKLLMGHNRAATKGKINKRSAHPFNHGHIFMAHNGTLYGHHKLPRRKPKKLFDVDSEAICHALSMEDEVKVLESLDGAYALTWYDQKADTLNFARNDERPLFIAINETKTKMIWASERPMIEWTLEKYYREKFDIVKLSEGELYSVKMQLPFSHNFSDPTITTFTPKDDYAYASWYSNRSSVAYLPNPNKKIVAGTSVNVTFDEFRPSKVNPHSTGALYGSTLDGRKVVMYGVHPGREVEDFTKGTYNCVIAYTDWQYNNNVQHKLLALRKSTALPVAEEVKKKETTYPGYNKDISEKEWNNKTAAGCAVCCGILEPEDVIWFDDNTPLHYACRDKIIV